MQIEGLTVSVSAESILQVSQENFLRRDKKQKEGWESALSLAQKLGHPQVVTVRKVLNELAELRPKEVEKQSDAQTGKTYLFYSPEIVREASEILLVQYAKLKETRDAKEQEAAKIRAFEDSIRAATGIDEYKLPDDLKASANTMIRRWKKEYMDLRPRKDEEEDVYNQKIIDHIAKQFESEIQKYRRSYTLSDLEVTFGSLGVKTDQVALRNLIRTKDASAVSFETIFGLYTGVLNVSKTISVLRSYRNEGLNTVADYLEQHRGKK